MSGVKQWYGYISEPVSATLKAADLNYNNQTSKVAYKRGQAVCVLGERGEQWVKGTRHWC